MELEDLDLSHRRSALLHRAVAEKLNEETLAQWAPLLCRNAERMSKEVRGSPHVENVREWLWLILERDVEGIRAVLVGLDPHSVEMREVSPCAGTLTESERREVLHAMRRPSR